jgi:DnaK suppressor protein
MSQVAPEPTLPEDEYLTPEELLKLHRVLRTQLEQILGRTHEAVSSLTAEEETEADELDVAVNASNREFMLRLADRERRMLGQIKAALSRMQEGEYGVCDGCGGEITFGRLLARPVATQCIDCKTEAEQLRGSRRAF